MEMNSVRHEQLNYLFCVGSLMSFHYHNVLRVGTVERIFQAKTDNTVIVVRTREGYKSFKLNKIEGPIHTVA